MLEIAIPNHEAELQQLEAIGLSGYFLGFGLRFGQPDFFMNKYPDAWTKEYETENYFFFGSLEVKMKAAPGDGIISSIVMESDALDEVDWVCVR